MTTNISPSNSDDDTGEAIIEGSKNQYRQKNDKSNFKSTLSYGAISEEQENDVISIPEIDIEIQKNLLRKLDTRLLCWTFFAHFANMLARNNLQNAFTMGMDKDLGLGSEIYNYIIASFFVGYILLQIPGNIIISQFSPRWILPPTVILSGTMVFCMSFSKEYVSLWFLRISLGVIQAPCYPGMIFLLGSWYKSEELGKRTIILATGSTVSGAIGGLIAGRIADVMRGVAGLATWRWLFIIEGLVGVIVGIVGIFVLPSFPHNTKWLTYEERRIAIQRMQRCQGKQKVTSNIYTWKIALVTPYPWLIAIMFTCNYISFYILQNFAIILRDIGFSVAFANYMLTPVYIYSIIVGLLIGWSSDSSGDRAFHIAGTEIWIATWCLILATVNNGDNPPILIFIGTYAIAMGSSLNALVLTWANEIYKTNQNTRAIAIAFINMFGNLVPNIICTKIWRVNDSPEFWVGKISSMCAAFSAVIVALVIWFMLRINFMVSRATDSKDDYRDRG